MDHMPGGVDRALEQRLEDLGYFTGSAIWESYSTDESWLPNLSNRDNTSQVYYCQTDQVKSWM